MPRNHERVNGRVAPPDTTALPMTSNTSSVAARAVMAPPSDPMSTTLYDVAEDCVDASRAPDQNTPQTTRETAAAPRMRRVMTQVLRDSRGMRVVWTSRCTGLRRARAACKRGTTAVGRLADVEEDGLSRTEERREARRDIVESRAGEDHGERRPIVHAHHVQRVAPRQGGLDLVSRSPQELNLQVMSAGAVGPYLERLVPRQLRQRHAA